MGYYLGVYVVYGVAWDDPPEQCYPVDVYDNVAVAVEDGETVHGGRLTWGRHGYLSGPAQRYLAVCEAPSGEPQGDFAVRVPWEEPDADDMIRWDAWIIDYLMQLGVPPGRIPAPGWLALGDFG